MDIEEFQSLISEEKEQYLIQNPVCIAFNPRKYQWEVVDLAYLKELTRLECSRCEKYLAVLPDEVAEYKSQIFCSTHCRDAYLKTAENIRDIISSSPN